MPLTLVLGAQWGDEGKGKLVDILAQKSSLCCRAAGGNNAGHTIIANNVTYDFHILPSGLASPDCKVNLIGAGCVVHVPSFFKEIEALEAKGLTNVRERILISDRAHICFDLHVALDGIAEDATAKVEGGKNNIGTTRKGIGPCYSDKVARLGVNFWMLVGEGDRWEARLRSLDSSARRKYGDEALAHYSVEEEISRFKAYKDELAPFIVDQVPLLASALAPKPSSDGFVSWQKPTEHNVLIEGANAILLDIDHGTYPFVTSSSTGLGGVFTGLAGVSPRNLTGPGSEVVGVVKAYTTRVGAGAFPTELDAAINPKLPASEAAYGEALQRIGREFGVTTGRKRRCGWLDLMTVKYSTIINAYTAINLTKLDILDTFDEIRVATSYTYNDQELPSFPADLDVLARLEVQYKTFKGWKTTTTGVKSFDDLPPAAKEYIEFIEREVGVPIKWIGTGPGREDMIIR